MRLVILPLYKKMYFVKIAAALLLGVTCLYGHAQDGTLDATFGSGGIVKTHVNGNSTQIYGTTMLADGKILACGTANNAATGYDFAIVKYNADGTLDNAFGTNGITITDIGSSEDICYAIAVQPDGKIVAGGTAGATRTLVRYNADGTLDDSFGFNGIMQSGEGIVVALDVKITGKIIAAITDQGIGCAQYNSDGTIDTNFGMFFGNSHVTNNPTEYTESLLLLPNGDAIIGGGFKDLDGKTGAALAKFKNNGLPDSSFGADGLSEIAYRITATKIKISSTGKLIIAGTYFYQDLDHNKFGLARFKANGIPDSTFGTNGVVATSIVPDNAGFIEDDITLALVLQPNNKIITAGRSASKPSGQYTIALARYTADGVLDAGFGTGGIVVTPIATYATATSLQLQPGGRLVAAGSSGSSTTTDFTLARYIDADALPVTLLNFTAAKSGKGIMLNWQTATELNSSYFAIERSNDGSTFTQMGQVKSAGTSSSLQQYSFYDGTAKQGNNYYRLKQVDIDGRFVYSKIAIVNMAGTITISAYPNPVKNNLYIQGLNPAAKSVITLTDINGKVIIAANVQASNYYLVVKNLAVGYYVVKVQAEGKVTAVKVVKE